MRFTTPMPWLAAAAVLSAASVTARPALAADQPAGDKPVLSVAAGYTADVAGVVRGAKRAGRYLDNLDVTADLDLEKAVGWSGAALHADILNNSGGAPNDVAGTLQGIDNIEVTSPRLRLFELWVEQTAGPASVRAGLYDLNSEFYSNDAAGLLIAPSFGIGSELAATGPNGPSIFPSTALGARLNIDLGEGRYVRTALVNAHSGVLGDPGGIDTSFGDGVLTIAETGQDGPTRFGVGVWRYSRRQDDIRSIDAAGDPLRRRAQGAYLLGEQQLGGEDGKARFFLRIGLSDGDTTPFRGGWQAGVRVTQPFASRPDSELSFGVQQGVLSRKFRANLRDDGAQPGRAESGLEITYSDRIARRVTVQPDLQWVRHAGGERDARDRVILSLRISVDLSPTAD